MGVLSLTSGGCLRPQTGLSPHSSPQGQPSLCSSSPRPAWGGGQPWKSARFWLQQAAHLWSVTLDTLPWLHTTTGSGPRRTCPGPISLLEIAPSVGGATPQDKEVFCEHLPSSPRGWCGEGRMASFPRQDFLAALTEHVPTTAFRLNFAPHNVRS